jgi:hypothetical protein
MIIVVIGMFVIWGPELAYYGHIHPQNQDLGVIKTETQCSVKRLSFNELPYVFIDEKGTYVYELSRVESNQILRDYKMSIDKPLPYEVMLGGYDVIVWSCGAQDPQQAVDALVRSRRSHSWCGTYTAPLGVLADDVCFGRGVKKSWDAMSAFMANFTRTLARTFNEVWAKLFK